MAVVDDELVLHADDDDGDGDARAKTMMLSNTSSGMLVSNDDGRRVIAEG